MGPPPKKRRRVVPPTQSESELVSNRPVRASKSTYRRSAVDHEQQNLNNQPVIDYAKLAEEILKKKKKKTPDSRLYLDLYQGMNHHNVVNQFII